MLSVRVYFAALMLVLTSGVSMTFSMKFYEGRLKKSEKQSVNQYLQKFLNDIEKFVTIDVSAVGRRRMTLGQVFYSRTAGQTVEVGDPDFLAHVSQKQGRVVYFLNRRDLPRLWPSVDEDGVIVSPEVIRAKSVRIDMRTAREIANRVLKRIVDLEIRAHLSFNGGELTYRGSYFVYEFYWVARVDESGFAPFFSVVRISINPEEGQLVSFRDDTSLPSGQDVSTDPEIRSEVLHAVDRLERQHSERTLVAPMRVWSREGNAQDVWLVQFGGNNAKTAQEAVYLDSRNLTELKLEDYDQTTDGLWDPAVVCP